MNYNAVLEALNQASLFELHRLNAAIRNQLDDPARIQAAKQALRVGQILSWFDAQENRLVDARLLKRRPPRAANRANHVHPNRETSGPSSPQRTP